jgi:catechol 2,3-dioxygenase-like lactoylglutathione lyase family enzyme
MKPRLIPELDVSNLEQSLTFYMEVIGFRLMFDRPEEKFAYLDLEGAHLMLEEASGPGRRFRVAPLEVPYGRGINFQIQVSDVVSIYDRVCSGAHPVIVALEDRWYRQDQFELGNRQFVVSDPDGYLLRLFSDLGAQPAK